MCNRILNSVIKSIRSMDGENILVKELTKTTEIMLINFKYPRILTKLFE